MLGILIGFCTLLCAAETVDNTQKILKNTQKLVPKRENLGEIIDRPKIELEYKVLVKDIK